MLYQLAAAANCAGPPSRQGGLMVLPSESSCMSSVAMDGAALPRKRPATYRPLAPSVDIKAADGHVEVGVPAR